MGCDKVAPECAPCYIDRTVLRVKNPAAGEFRKPWGKIFRTSESLWKNPAKWERKAPAIGKALRIFTCRESDFFRDKVDTWRHEA